jgi:hypothetical protein
MAAGAKKRPSVEVLEERTLLSNILLVDFSPDWLPHEGRRLPPFSHGFQIRNAHGRPFRFLDFDHDGRVNGNDVRLMAQAIVQRVDTYFAGYDLTIESGDLGKNTQLGLRTRQIALDAATPEHVYVIYVGGVAFGGDISTFGEAYQAPVGYNLEYYAYAFSESMIRWYQQNLRSASPQEFANDLGTTVAHEFGHLLGLGHVLGNPLGDPNPMNYNANPDTAYFPDATYPQIELRDTNLNAYWAPQDPAAEIRASLAGQPAYDTTGLIYNIAPGGSKRLASREVTSALEISGTRLPPRPHHPAGAGKPAHRGVKDVGILPGAAWADAVAVVHAGAA